MTALTRPKLALAAAVVAAGIGAASAQAAPRLGLDASCYAQGDRIAFTASGFAPAATVTVALATRSHMQATHVTADAAGTATGSMRVSSRTLGRAKRVSASVIASVYDVGEFGLPSLTSSARSTTRLSRGAC